MDTHSAPPLPTLPPAPPLDAVEAPEADAPARVPAHPGRAYSLAVGGALLLLLAAVAFLYWPATRTTSEGATTAAALAAAGEVYVSDLDFWQRTPRESTVAALSHFDLNHDLRAVPLQVGDWVGEEKPEKNQEVLILLQPEQYVQRLYRNSQGQGLWLSMVGGRSSQPFHAPDICYDADGWQYDLGSHAIPLAGGGSVYGLYLDAHKPVAGQDEPLRHVVLYFYLFPNANRALADGIVLFKLTSGRIGTLEETLAMQEDFVRQYFKAAAPGAVTVQSATGL